MTQQTPVRAATAKVVTANHLLTGDVIYLSRQSIWERSLSDAALFTDEAEAAQALERATKPGRPVVGAYLADAKPGPHGPEPLHTREAIRATGPGL